MFLSFEVRQILWSKVKIESIQMRKNNLLGREIALPLASQKLNILICQVLLTYLSLGKLIHILEPLFSDP